MGQYPLPARSHGRQTGLDSGIRVALENFCSSDGIRGFSGGPSAWELLMISKALVQQIEAHSARLAQEVLAEIRNDARTQSYQKLPERDLREAVEGLFHHLGRWLTDRTDFAVERRYQKIGRQRYLQGVPLSEMIHALAVVRMTLIRFLRGSAVGESAELLMEYELALSICEFAEKSIYYASRGYEDARAAGLTAAAAPKSEEGEVVAERFRREAWDPAEEWDPNMSRGGDVPEVSG
jgi:hypothetical protein